MNMQHTHRSFAAIVLAVSLLACGASNVHAQLKAGIYLKNINPKTLPVWVNGNIAAVKSDRIHDPLNARCLVLDDGRIKLAICVVDSCIIPIELIDEARALTAKRTGINPSHILISSTHTHSAVSVAGAHGTPVQEDYAAALPTWIAEGIEQAIKNLVPAQLGTASVVCDKYIYCRRWMMKPGTADTIPFIGRTSNQVNMNPGYDNPNRLWQVGPVDTLIPILAIQTADGKPLSLLASFSTHYAGAPSLSADYFAVVCNTLGEKLRPEDPTAFMGLMANATSGDANCIDFSKPSQPFTHVDVGRYVAEKILSVVPDIKYQSKINLAGDLQTLTVAARVPPQEEVAEAKKYMETHFPNRLPTSLIENYARETILLSEMPATRDLRLQVFRIGDLGIVANPCEAYGETGLKLRQASPFALTMNIGLANGHAGYIPPPEHFQLGGYTTWRARSSCLEEQAEPKMVAGLTELMQQVHGQ
jgi:neutral ceramidase